jgi:hypothetical protein
MMLKGVGRGTRKEPRIALYAPPKWGKTQFGASFPSPIFVTTEDGADALPVDCFATAKDWQAVIDNLTTVATGDHEYKTVVLDTLGGAVELAAIHVCNTIFGGDWGARGYSAYGQGAAATSEEIRRLLPILDQCRDRGMTVLLLSHTGLQNVKSPTTGDFQKYAPDMDRKVWGRVAKWADMIGRGDFEYVLVGEEGRRKVKGTNTRIIHWSGSAAEDAGCRAGYELPDETLLSYPAFAEALGKGASVVEECKALWHVMDKERADKALAWLGVKKLEDADLQKLKELLNRLRALAAEKTEVENEEVVNG